MGKYPCPAGAAPGSSAQGAAQTLHTTPRRTQASRLAYPFNRCPIKGVRAHLAQALHLTNDGPESGEVKASPKESHSQQVTTPSSGQHATLPPIGRIVPYSQHPKRPNWFQSAGTYRTGFSLFGDRRPGQEEGQGPQDKKTKRNRKKSVSSSHF